MWPMVIAYLLAIRFSLVYELGTHASNYRPWMEELMDGLYLVATNAFLTYAAYFLERTDRIEFIESLVQDNIRQNTQALLNNIMPKEIQDRIRQQEDIHMEMKKEDDD